MSFKIGLLVLASLIGCSVAQCCPPLWTQFGNSCYRYYGTPFLNWKNAEAKCMAEGAHLVSILDSSEYEFVLEYWRSARGENPNLDIYPFRGAARNPFLHIGLNDIEVNGEFKWTDGSPVSFTDWMPRNPTLTAPEEGVMMWDRNIPKAGLWNDIRSASRVLKAAFICKYKNED